MKLKVLRLKNVFGFADLHELLNERILNGDEEIKPLYRRNGVYLQGDYCWVEIEGRAFKHDPASVQFSLSTFTIWWKYNERQIKALELAIRERVATKEQEVIHGMWMQKYELMQMIRNWSRV